MPKRCSLASAAPAVVSFLVFSYPSGTFGDPPLVVDDAKPVDKGYWKFDWVGILSQPQEGARDLRLEMSNRMSLPTWTEQSRRDSHCPAPGGAGQTTLWPLPA